MLTQLDDSLWHQLPTTFDHVGTSDPRFFDRLWFAASDRKGGATLQFTMGVYQNMNVVDGGVVAIVDGKQHNLRVSRQLRPTYDTACGPLRIEIVEPMRHIRLHIAQDTFKGVLDWRATLPPQEERQHYKRSTGRIIEDYARYDQVGSCSGWLELNGVRLAVDDWWACRDHSWGVRERVGIVEPRTGEVPQPVGGLFSFLFYSTDAYGGHVQVANGADGSRYLSAAILDSATGTTRWVGQSAEIEVDFIDDARPRRMRRAAFDVTAADGERTRIEVEALGPSVAMPGLGYGGYHDGLGLGVWRGLQHLESEIWDVAHHADVGYPDGTIGRPIHRIQPVRVVQYASGMAASTGFGSLTFIAEGPLDAMGIRAAGGG
jgi:hypothetical protein